MVLVFREAQSSTNPSRGIFAPQVIAGDGQRNDNDIVFACVVVKSDQIPCGQKVACVTNAVGQLDVVGDFLFHLFAVFGHRRSVRFIAVLVDFAWPVRAEERDEAREGKRWIVRDRANVVVVTSQEASFILGQPHGRASLEQANYVILPPGRRRRN